ncbi:MAG TPA: L-threonylcarbamoyladenylate synthase [Solirubrobacteraceae bacterium]|jgi:L-threonylcarbamoyladenylate synthase|nr:L-threonylcarbamoyladenylate synthase [Solirubrobacteraceae bacterium]
MTATAALSVDEATRLGECVRGGGVAVYPSDTVYGVCCDPDNEAAAQRLYELKGRPPTRPAAVMFFALQPALQALPELGEGERRALGALLPGPVTLLLENRSESFLAACRQDPATLGLRVPWLPESLHALASIAEPVMQTSANLSGESDARTLGEVPSTLCEGADLVLDGGTLPGTPSTVIDLRGYEATGSWHVLREGALTAEAVRELLDGER